ncbi:glycosyltransferase [Ornithinimicrobium sp. W1679]|uniref:glycosyltransferase n=1 Tax=unclassified Ornithinimicrobium TaxID=2615080 RepID=UPI003CEC291A
MDVSVVTSGHDLADARLHREVAALVGLGIRVEVLALGHGVDAPAGSSARTWRRRGPAGRAALAGEMAVRARGRVLLAHDPDSAVAAGAVVRATGRRLVVDVHEDYGALLHDRPWARRMHGLPGILARGLVRTFQEVAARADLTVVADDHVPPLRARHRLLLPNVPYPGMLPAPALPDPRPRAVYVGDVRASRGLFAMFAALRGAPDWTLDVVGPVAPADRPAMEAALDADPDLARRVRLHGRRPPVPAWADAAGAWCGLVLLADTPAFRRAVPSKLAEYLACGLPVVTTDLPRQADVVGTTGAGSVVPTGDDEQVGAAVAEVLRGWSQQPGTLSMARESARREGSCGPAAQAPALYQAFAGAVADLL